MTKEMNWSALAADPRFLTLQRKKSVFLWRLFGFGVTYYFMLPIGAAWWTDIFRVQVWGVVNIGLLFALSQFVVAWGIAFIYTRKAAEFDAMADELVCAAHKGEG
ncbi:MAG: DUF485 domain-containing protein [Alphaproteobacteria bacterium]